MDALVKLQWFVFRGVLFFVMTHSKRTICMYGAAPLGQVKRHFRPNILRAERTVGVPSDWNRSRKKTGRVAAKQVQKVPFVLYILHLKGINLAVQTDCTLQSGSLEVCPLQIPFTQKYLFRIL